MPPYLADFLSLKARDSHASSLQLLATLVLRVFCCRLYFCCYLQLCFGDFFGFACFPKFPVACVALAIASWRFSC
jgi:hypothetical protein